MFCALEDCNSNQITSNSNFHLHLGCTNFHLILPINLDLSRGGTTTQKIDETRNKIQEISGEKKKERDE